MVRLRTAIATSRQTTAATAKAVCVIQSVACWSSWAGGTDSSGSPRCSGGGPEQTCLGHKLAAEPRGERGWPQPSPYPRGSLVRVPRGSLSCPREGRFLAHTLAGEYTDGGQSRRSSPAPPHRRRREQWGRSPLGVLGLSERMVLCYLRNWEPRNSPSLGWSASGGSRRLRSLPRLPSFSSKKRWQGDEYGPAVSAYQTRG